MGDLREPEPEDVALATLLGALSNPVRIAMLRVLRTPRTLSEIRVAPGDPPAGAEERAMSRQSVRKHIDQLLQAGVIEAQPAERDFGETMEYVVNHQRLFAITEELRELAHLRPVKEPPAGATVATDGWQAKGEGYPRLLLVRGLGEGRSFPVRPAGPQAAWVIGRKQGASVRLDYDAFASLENALLTCARGAYHVEDLGSRNGTFVNFVRVEPGAPRLLRHGDLLGVGHSLLLLQLDG
jgi:DNA-binding transcriptional ArsR family regulator